MYSVSFCAHLFSHCQNRLNFGSKSLSRQMGVSVRTINMLQSHTDTHTETTISTHTLAKTTTKSYTYVRTYIRTHIYNTAHIFIIHSMQTNKRTMCHIFVQRFSIQKVTICVWFCVCFRLESLISLMLQRILSFQVLH